ncbi:hypothetical protein L6452_11719 [Arctium lappa]|uniref:Uncharacterized protein n=1 Tax=Arctium lappa TaxID=4217 RepID=A0ACB9DQH7_ARCLA|nr:hypothetical protein L6452_11719 [Arctium lappa]
MNTPFFIFIVFSTFSLSTGQTPVLDIAGSVVRSSLRYYIVPAIRGSGGGVKLAPTTINQTCPLDVAQENNELLDGLPLKFVPANTNKDGTIFESTDLNIKFSDATTCGRPAVWRVEDSGGQRVVSSRGVVGNPGRETISNWFKIEKYEDGYKVVFCPSVCNSCRPACADIGSTIAKNGRRSLVLNNVPLKVVFKKAN